MTDLQTNLANTVVTRAGNAEERFRASYGDSRQRHHHYTGGFLAAETVWRQRALASDINTPFNAVPMPGASTYNVSEFFGSGRQSRVSMLAEGRLKEREVIGLC